MRYRNFILPAVLALAVAGLHGDQVGDLSGRAQRIGQQLICPCGCTQGALVCNHVGCPVVTQLRAEIVQRSASSENDELVLQSFVQEYGTQVLANPTKQGFNLLAWVMPWMALAFGLVLVLFFVRRFRQAAPAGTTVTYPELQSEVQAEIQSELEAELGPRRKP